jgi:putative ABC transport system permease protein
VLARRKFFTFVSLFGITFPLAILLVAATLLDHIFGAAPPETRQDRTLGVYRASLLDDEGRGVFAFPSYGLLDRHMRDLPGAEKASISSLPRKATLYRGQHRFGSYVKYTDAEFWDVLDFEFVSGRAFAPEEVDGGAPVAVINEASQQRYFPDDSALGKVLEVEGLEYTVVGVVRNVPMLRLVSFSDIWVPQTTAEGYYNPDELYGLHLGLILAESRDDFPRIRAEFASRVASVDLSGHRPFRQLIAVPETTFDSVARTVFTQGRSSERQSTRLLTVLILGAVLFLVLPTINLVNLNLSRMTERGTEIGVRRAFGAASRTLVGQFVTESVLLTVVGGALALAVAFFILGLVSGAGLIPYAQFHPNLRILAYATAATLFLGLLSGAYPAWRMARMNPADALRGGQP